MQGCQGGKTLREDRVGGHEIAELDPVQEELHAVVLAFVMPAIVSAASGSRQSLTVVTLRLKLLVCRPVAGFPLVGLEEVFEGAL